MEKKEEEKRKEKKKTLFYGPNLPRICISGRIVGFVLLYSFLFCSVFLPVHSWKLSVLEFPLDKELTTYCLVETCTKPGELILAVMVLKWADRVPFPY